MIIDDTVRLVYVCTCYCWETFLGNEFGQKMSVMLWAGDESKIGLIKTNNSFTKISFITKLDIYAWSCSIIDVYAYPERKQNNFYYNIKIEIHSK